jgi:6,7-dimethyl-8-ribityllumazine synthase
MTSENEKLLDTTGIRIEKDACVIIVKTTWNAPVVDALEQGVLSILNNLGVKCYTFTVPGAIEIGFAIQKIWENAKGSRTTPSAFIALGCVIKGETPHFDYVCQSVTSSVTLLNLQLPVPTIFGVLTVNHLSEAEERIGGKHGHKGKEFAVTALKMMELSAKAYLK